MVCRLYLGPICFDRLNGMNNGKLLEWDGVIKNNLLLFLKMVFFLSS